MGTNYYLKLKKLKELETPTYVMRNNKLQELKEKIYAYQENVIHIGKKSAGWPFTIQICDEFHNYDELENYLKENEGNYTIVNEYKKELDFEELKDIMFYEFKTINYETRDFS